MGAKTSFKRTLETERSKKKKEISKKTKWKINPDPQKQKGYQFLRGGYPQGGGAFEWFRGEGIFWLPVIAFVKREEKNHPNGFLRG